MDAAIEYIFGRNDVDGLHNHEYIEGKDGECYICRDPLDDHRARILPMLARAPTPYSGSEEEKSIIQTVNNGRSRGNSEHVGLRDPQLIRERSKTIADRLIK